MATFIIFYTSDCASIPAKSEFALLLIASNALCMRAGGQNDDKEHCDGFVEFALPADLLVSADD